MSIRTDERQWLIYEEESVSAVVGGIQAFFCLMGAHMASKHEDIAVRAMANAAERIVETQMSHWLGKLKGLEPTEAQETVTRYLAEISAWMGGEGERPDEALDEIWAALVWLDGRAKAAGVTGPGWYREIVRETSVGR